MLVFHLATRRTWDAATLAGVYAPPSLASEGFVHCSFAHQLTLTANRYYAGEPDLLAVAFDGELLGEALVVEDTSGHGEFPHIYASLNPSDAVAVCELSEGPAGFVLPDHPVFATST